MIRVAILKAIIITSKAIIEVAINITRTINKTSITISYLILIYIRIPILKLLGLVAIFSIIKSSLRTRYYSITII